MSILICLSKEFQFGIGNIKSNTQEIMQYRDPETPACVIESGTLPEEKVIFGTLKNIAENEIKTPAILIIGNVIDVYKGIYEFKNEIN